MGNVLVWVNLFKRLAAKERVLYLAQCRILKIKIWILSTVLIAKNKTPSKLMLTSLRKTPIGVQSCLSLISRVLSAHRQMG